MLWELIIIRHTAHFSTEHLYRLYAIVQCVYTVRCLFSVGFFPLAYYIIVFVGSRHSVRVGFSLFAAAVIAIFCKKEEEERRKESEREKGRGKKHSPPYS